VALFTTDPTSQTTAISSGAVYNRPNVADNSYFSEWRCLQQTQRRRQQLFQRVALLTAGPTSPTTAISTSGAANGRPNVADNSYSNEWRCRYLPLRLPAPTLFTVLIPLTIVFVGEDAKLNAYSEQMENFTLSFGMLKMTSQRILQKHA
jgi:hypothetical protein